MNARSPGLGALDRESEATRFLAAIVASSNDAIISADPSGIIASWNAAAERTFGYTPAEAVGRPLSIIVPPERIPEFKEFLERLNRGESIEHIETVRIRKGGTPIHVSLTVSPIRGGDGTVVGVSGILRDVDERHRAAEALRESEERFRQLAEHVTDVFWLVAADLSRAFYVNPAFEDLFGRPATEVLKEPKSWITSVHPEDRGWVTEAVTRRVRGETTGASEIEYRIVRPDGDVRWVRSATFPVQDHRGVTTRLAGIVSDITPRKLAENRQALLMSELDHRVKNTLATVIALADQILEGATTLEGFRGAFVPRLQTLARAHEVLAEAHWEHADLAEVAAIVLRAFASDESQRIVWSGEPLPLHPRAALPVALALHELGTNAIKHGALRSVTGEVRVEWERAPQGGAVLCWREHGGPPVDLPLGRGTGRAMIEDLIHFQLEGQVDWHPSVGGLTCVLRIPAQADVAAT